MGLSEERYRGALLGLAVGDAVGTTLEFAARGTFEPVTDMVGGGPFSLEPGQWTDDTSMALCLATSLIHCDGFDPRDQMNRYCNWADFGYMSSNGACFDIGMTVAGALARYRETGEVFAGSRDPRSAGNGSLMRLAPVVMFFHPGQEQIRKRARDSSRTTHGADEALTACEVFALMLSTALEGAPKDTVLSSARQVMATGRLKGIVAGSYRGLSADAIRGTGYVVDCLEAALWSFEQTESFRDAVLAAANLGDDADTTAAVCGQISGAFYGESGIPPSWLDRLAMGSAIRDLADELWRRAAERELAPDGPLRGPQVK